MPLTLEKYAEMLDRRGEPCPAGPVPEPVPKVRPTTKPLPAIRAVVYSGYGVGMTISGGEFAHLNHDPIMRNIALDKTVREFKMWASMTRKPGEPADYMATMFRQVHDALMMRDAQLKDYELRIEKIWEGIIGRLMQKDYVIESGTYGELEEFAKKVAYFYVRASQGVALLPGASEAMEKLQNAELLQGLHCDWQCTEPVRLGRLLADASKLRDPPARFEQGICHFSGVMGFKKSCDRGFALLVQGLQGLGVAPESTLYVGADVEADIVPAKRRGFRTALLMADRLAVRAKPEHLQDPRSRPDRLLTEIGQLIEIAT